MKAIASRKLRSTVHITNHTLRPPSVPKIKPATRPSIVYYIRIRFKDKTTVYKIGYTSMTTDKRVNGYYCYKTKRRTIGMGLPCGCTWVNIAILYSGDKDEAYRREQSLHRQWVNDRYYGANRLGNGNSELYRYDVLNLDRRRD